MLWWLVPAVLMWLAVLLAPWRPWSTRERLEASANAEGADLRDIAVLIPARNEAAVLGQTLGALAVQGQGLKVVVVDDQSTDETRTVALAATEGTERVVVSGEPLPAGWTGKVWAMEQGRAHLDRPLTLLLDADIVLAPGLLPALRDKLETDARGLVSLMADVAQPGLWGKLLMPAYVFFFKLLYPFALSNSAFRGVAAAAGGCVLLRTEVLERIGGFGALRAALIDDCTLARLVKTHGYRTWIGLTRSATSIRRHTGFGDVWDLVVRTAFTQLRYSVLWLVLCTVLMGLAFLVPAAVASAGLLGVAGIAGNAGVGLAVLTLGLMAAAYVPTLRFYGMSALWSLLMPVIGAIYLAMTWGSAFRHWWGDGVGWHARTYGNGGVTDQKAA